MVRSAQDKARKYFGVFCNVGIVVRSNGLTTGVEYLRSIHIELYCAYGKKVASTLGHNFHPETIGGRIGFWIVEIGQVNAHRRVKGNILHQIPVIGEGIGKQYIVITG